MTTIIRYNFRKSGVVDAVVREIAAMMERLLETGEPGIVDLRSSPMTDLHRFELAEKLGDGEVRAIVNAGGASTVFETKFAGVWWVRHENTEGRILSERIIVARAPGVLLAHPSDISAARTRLNKLLVQPEASSHPIRRELASELASDKLY
ncbi:MAG: hydrogenase expression/formation C-terminal domain-containing protein [Rhodomicrobium sp.]